MRSLNLSSKSNKLELVKQLMDYAADSANDDKESSNSENMGCAAILVVESEIDQEMEMKTRAKDSFTRVLDEEELFVADAGGELAVGNRRGLNLWTCLSTLERNVGRRIPRFAPSFPLLGRFPIPPLT